MLPKILLHGPLPLLSFSKPQPFWLSDVHLLQETPGPTKPGKLPSSAWQLTSPLVSTNRSSDWCYERHRWPYNHIAWQLFCYFQPNVQDMALDHIIQQQSQSYIPSTEVQEHNTTMVYIKKAVPANYPSPGVLIHNYMSMQASQENYGSPARIPSMTPSEDSPKAGYSELLFITYSQTTTRICTNCSLGKTALSRGFVSIPIPAILLLGHYRKRI